MSTNAPIKKPTPPTPEEIRSRKQDRLAGAVSPQESGSGGRREYFASQPSDFPLQPCDLKKWLKHDSLPIERACFVLLGFEPPPLHVLLSVQDKYNLSRERTWDRPPRYNDVFASLCVSIEHGNISIHKIREGQYETKQVSWPDLVRWAWSKDYPIAPGLETLIADIEPVQTSAIATGTAPAQDTLPPATKPAAADAPAKHSLAVRCAIFREMGGAAANELTIEFRGKDEPLTKNSELYITAKSNKKTASTMVSIGELGLALRGTRDGLNGEGKLLEKMLNQSRFIKTQADNGTLGRLKNILRSNLGINGNIFEEYRPGVGWKPLFNLVDKRGAADKRAKESAEYHTASIEQMADRGVQIAAPARSDKSDDSGTDIDERYQSNKAVKEWVDANGLKWKRSIAPSPKTDTYSDQEDDIDDDDCAVD